jgi:hypothetical protein
VVEALRGQFVDVREYVGKRGTYYWGVITAQQLVEVARLLPKEELEVIYNGIPPIKDFVELARREPSTLFLIHVRIGDFVIVEGMLVPWDKMEFAKAVIRELKKRHLHPDEVSPAVELDAGGRRIFITPSIVEDKFVNSLTGDVDDDHEEEGDLMFIAPWYDILTMKGGRLTRKDFEALVAKGKGYIMLWWD